MHVEHLNNGEIRVTFDSKYSYWNFLEVAEFKETPWGVRIWDKEKYHLAADFPKTIKEYY